MTRDELISDIARRLVDFEDDGGPYGEVAEELVDRIVEWAQYNLPRT
jgi:hypothetical protein